MNKFYIQFVLFLLTISLFVNNKVLATEPTPRKATKRQLKKYCPTPEQIFLKNKNLLCTNPEETREAIKLMNEAARHLEYHATIKNDYKYMGAYPDYNLNFYEKEHKDHIKVGKFQYIVRDTNKYNETIDEFWDPDCINFLDYKNTKRKIVRVCNPNLVMIQQRYKTWCLDREKYFYALAAKFNVSENKTIIAMTSANINDHNPSKKKYKNTIIESANLFKTDIDSDDDIKNGKLEKAFVNVAGYLIEKKNGETYITYVESVSDI
ncbi:hypothetical protein YYG_01147 [Plasmodium vinckei petteri]|uniref:Fam-a protein n=1 Tax=Plasmodium vinckei petteri TaxID=138298 RepID=W7B7Q5_PLAVN|nr:hypothetical protein YYG_01147 [Plasmodium vinckei petteri]